MWYGIKPPSEKLSQLIFDLPHRAKRSGYAALDETRSRRSARQEGLWLHAEVDLDELRYWLRY